MFEFLKNQKKVLIHVFAWIFFAGIVSIQLYLDRGKVPEQFFVRLLFNILFFYVNYSILIPKLLLKKKMFYYILSFIGLVLTTIVLFKSNFPRLELTLNTTIGYREQSVLVKRMLSILPFFFHILFLILGIAIRVYEEWNKNESNKKDVEAEKTSTELQFLKNQLNPHFLFNSLNSIYSLTTKKSNDAPEAVITLSEMMRYMLYQTNNEFVLLHNELDYIQNYLKLQRLRIANNERVTINIHGLISNQKIKPLLLISFIENAFKYGTDFKGNTEVKIIIQVDNDKLNFKCLNILGVRKGGIEDSGIGLKNSKERLELLYPEKHTLIVKEENEKFIVDLTLKLKE